MSDAELRSPFYPAGGSSGGLCRPLPLVPTARCCSVAKNVSVVLDSASSPADLTADSLVSGILSRYQQLLRSKVSWTGAEGAPSAGGELGATAAALVVVTAKITGCADGATDLGPETDESYGIAVTTSPPAATVTARCLGCARVGDAGTTRRHASGRFSPRHDLGLAKVRPRGLMIDTGRHFERGHDQARHRRDGHPVLRLMTLTFAEMGVSHHRAVRAGNVLHWHVTRLPSQSSPRFPALRRGLPSAATYSLEELREVAFLEGGCSASYGCNPNPGGDRPPRSIAAGWTEIGTVWAQVVESRCRGMLLSADAGLLTSCDDVCRTRDSTYTFLGDFLKEMTTVFTDSLIYLGGDESAVEIQVAGAKKCGYHCSTKTLPWPRG